MNTNEIPRVWLAQLTNNQRLIRYLENLGLDVTDALPSQIDTAQLSADQALANALSAESVALEALNNSLSEVQDSQNALSSQLAELSKQMPEDNSAAIQSLLADIAELKKLSMKPKRIINASIAVTAGNTLGTYTITPACDLATTTLNANGQYITPGLALDSALLSLELANATTVRAVRGASLGTSTVYFQLVEY